MVGRCGAIMGCMQQVEITASGLISMPAAQFITVPHVWVTAAVQRATRQHQWRPPWALDRLHAQGTAEVGIVVSGDG